MNHLTARTPRTHHATWYAAPALTRRRLWLLALLAALAAADVAGIITSPAPLAYVAAERP